MIDRKQILCLLVVLSMWMTGCQMQNAGAVEMPTVPKSLSDVADEGSASKDEAKETPDQVGYTSPWQGCFLNKDGQLIQGNAVDEYSVYVEFWGYQPMRLDFTDAEKKTASTLWKMQDEERTITFNLSDDEIEVKVEPEGNGMEGKYKRRKDICFYQQNPDGSVSWLGEFGEPRKDTLVPDGWITDENGIIDKARGMRPFVEGEYLSRKTQNEIAQERFTFTHEGEVLEWEDVFLAEGETRKKIGTVDYAAFDQNGEISYEKTGMAYYNTAEGYEIADVSDEVFARFSLVGSSGYYLMIQMEGGTTPQGFAYQEPEYWGDEVTGIPLEETGLGPELSGQWEISSLYVNGESYPVGDGNAYSTLSIDYNGFADYYFRDWNGREISYLAMPITVDYGVALYEGYSGQEWSATLETGDDVWLYACVYQREMTVMQFYFEEGQDYLSMVMMTYRYVGPPVMG